MKKRAKKCKAAPRCDWMIAESQSATLLVFTPRKIKNLKRNTAKYRFVQAERQVGKEGRRRVKRRIRVLIKMPATTTSVHI